MEKHRRHPNPILWAKLHTVAREMRKEPTPAEDLLWQHLRGRQLGGYKFLRQFPIHQFVVDFCCFKAGLIIEVDGEVHQQQIELDQERDQILIELGFRVIRFSNTQVFGQIVQVLSEIMCALES